MCELPRVSRSPRLRLFGGSRPRLVVGKSGQTVIHPKTRSGVGADTDPIQVVPPRTSGSQKRPLVRFSVFPRRWFNEFSSALAMLTSFLFLGSSAPPDTHEASSRAVAGSLCRSGGSRSSGQSGTCETLRAGSTMPTRSASCPYTLRPVAGWFAL